MTKNFCDICGEPAKENIRAESERNLGVPYTAFRDGCEGRHQMRVTTHVQFGFLDHPKGFGGPPDLCAKCARDLVAEVLTKMMGHSSD